MSTTQTLTSPKEGFSQQGWRDEVALRVSARLFDLLLGVLLLAFLLFGLEVSMPWMVLVPSGAFLLDAAFYALCGTTPGRYWVGLRVVNRTGAPLSGREYLRRNGALWFKGAAACLMPLSIVTFLFAYRQLLRGEPPVYDRRSGHGVTRVKELSSERKGAFLLALWTLALIGLAGCGLFLDRLLSGSVVD